MWAAVTGTAVDTADNAAARTALVGAAAGTAVTAVDVSDNTAATAAAADSAGDLYRCACRIHRHCGLDAPRSGRCVWL